jgi:single-strand DNA-binding protein
MSINVHTFSGHLTRDVVLRRNANGTPVAFYVVAANTYNTSTQQTETDFIPVNTYGRQAEADAAHLRKGSGVTVLARVRSWWDADKRQGGFRFEARQVDYHRDHEPAGRESERPGERGAADGTDDGRDEGGADPWLQDYEQAMAGDPGPQAR